MNIEEKKEILAKTGAFLEGHFQLSSGLHSKYYFQCALIMQFPDTTEMICKDLAKNFSETKIDKVLSPALGGIIAGYEMARALKCKSIFAEREEGKMTLRRGFQITQGENVLIAEDVTTTGGSVLELEQIVRKHSGNAVGFVAFVDRSGGKFKPVKKFVSWFQMEIENYQPTSCPLCKDGITLIKPGSRK